jgi:hypothetical protein
MEPLPTVQRLLPTLIFFFSMENANEGGKLWQATTTKMQDPAREKRAQILGQIPSESFEKTEENIRMTLHIHTVFSHVKYVVSYS